MPRYRASSADSASGRVECRAADISCNPYLEAALILAAGREGIRERLNPGRPDSENRYNYSDAEIAESNIRFLPESLAEATDGFETNPCPVRCSASGCSMLLSTSSRPSGPATTTLFQPGKSSTA